MDCTESYRFLREFSKQRISLFEEFTPGPGATSGRQLDPLAMEALNAMNQQGAVAERADRERDLFRRTGR